MAKYMVTFMPVNRSTMVEEGTTVAEAARQADVFIKNLCGGEGVCGQCRVQITSGNAKPDEQAKAFFSEEELDRGYVLACQTEVYDNLEVLIPPETRMEAAKIITTEGEEGEAEAGAVPLVRKIYLEMPAPTLEDNISDIERVTRELRKKIGWHSYNIGLPCLRRLSEKLRQSDFKVTASVAKHSGGYRILRIDPGDTSANAYGLAVDVGTTTVVAQLVEMGSGRILGVSGTPNNQASFGEDVISRIIHACKKDGLEPVHKAVIKNVNELIETLTSEKSIDREDIIAITAAGNTTMSHLLLGLIPCSIRLDPYVPTADIYPQIYAREIGIQINPEGILETLPSVASYVGGDIVAGVLACGIPDKPEVQGLIDIGTNGEIAIGNNEWLVCCSASAGPAFEGGGTRCGMRATKGAIEKIEISEGKLKYQTIGNAKPRGLCGSGLIDCIYELVKNGIIAPDGKFNRDLKDDRFAIVDDIPEYTIAFAEETESGEPIVITETDIDNLMKSKGAVFAAIKSLMDYIGMGFDQIHRFYVAGGFGNFLNIEKSIAIGLLPDIPKEDIEFIGNSSLTGARLCLLSEKALEKSFNISRAMTNIELSNYQPFMDEFVAALFLPHTNRKLFPSVTY
ncbi:MAG: DUF4445 domain-containing protein [Deltaproteobacteria bacterium]|nr:DUF4445 domain-containing protein [Deltaproteobacteria bacterium]MBW2083156.1 DUF4445 domain-containing protein [Deltaproteobacteria bacterium]HDM10712.1 DUF4445 domain-containing protein [Desulfobacteraceae bacterium]